MMLRVLTYNILDGGMGREPYIQEVIHAAEPDVVVLQEAYTTALVPNLAQSLHADYFIAKGTTKRQVALLSRLPIMSRTSVRRFPPIHRSVLEAELDCAPNPPIWIVGVHLIAFPSILFELWRLWELNAIIHRTHRHGATPSLVVGDFNALAPRDPVMIDPMATYLKWMIVLQGYRIPRLTIGTMLRAGFTDCFRQSHPTDAGFTSPPPKPNARFDYIFANAAMTRHLHDSFVVREPAAVENASDHYPVMAVFRL